MHAEGAGGGLLCAQAEGWRWAQWAQSLSAGPGFLLSCLAYSEMAWSPHQSIRQTVNSEG